MSDEISIPNPGYRRGRPGRYGRSSASANPDAKRLALFAGGVGVALICLIGGATLVSHRSATVPVITADSRPIRVRPENPGGMQIDGAENDVFSGGANTAEAKLAPAAEAPDPNGLRVAALAPPVVAPAPPSPAPAPAAAKLATAAKPVTATPSGSRPAPVQAPAAQPAAPASGHAGAVQLAALTTEPAARAEWQMLQHRMPDLLTGRKPEFSSIQRGGQTFWRVRTAGFTDSARARAFCDQVKAKGGGCSVVDF
jgi:cell division septation protein DedD